MNHPGETRTRRRDAAENRQRILDVASMLFEKHGVEKVSMNQLATEAQIGPGTLYRHYRNKSELCLELIKDNVVILFEDIEAYLEQHKGDMPRQRLKGVLSIFIRFRETKLQLLTGVEEGADRSRTAAGRRNPIYDQLHEVFTALFDEMNTAGQPSPDSVFRSDLLLTVLRSDTYLFQRNVRGLSPESILEQLCLTFCP
ncbi:TetR/AcrR family transcriptional regulator [Alicyclobacillus sp. SO9]|uniref:TetR/AcrR family transcriptional regulator n=1 Tax=Alicyclobacillus sp. SO9 TaxID=2665646 RepID=UPI0018E7EEC6|nr:TetR/AcrR family transcriptional regulator [Alicyclobacillus sp. SO9]QQE78795.1 TetR/AcrR family transcriptional regulator [Alicyclobacillus sp. SO9]